MSEQVCELNFADYYEDWIATYKEGAIRKPTMAKYKQSLKWVRQLAPNLLLSQLTGKNIKNCSMNMLWCMNIKLRWIFITS